MNCEARPYFRYDRDLLKDLCRIAHECLVNIIRNSFSVEKMQVTGRIGPTPTVRSSTVPA